MAKFCTECGKEITEGVAFCTECGTKAPADPAQNVTEAEAKRKEVAEADPVVHTPYIPPREAQPYQTQQTYTPPTTAPSTGNTVGTGAYFGLMLLYAIPLLGFVSCLIMAFAPKNKNLKNFARATLIWKIILLVLTAVLIAGIIALGNSLVVSINEATGGQITDLGELFDRLVDLGGLAK